MKHGLCIGLAVGLALLMGCRSASRTSTQTPRTSAGGAAAWRAEGERLVVGFVRSLTADQVSAANGAGGGLLWSQLTKEQQAALQRMWELTESILFSKPGARERVQAAGLAPEPGPIEYAKVTGVGYAVVSGDGGQRTLFRFSSDRLPVTSGFEARVSKVGLTPALKKHGVNLNETGEVPR
jgi:hypothetical protein